MDSSKIQGLAQNRGIGSALGKANSRRALILDRDGVINVDKGFVYKQEDIEWIPGIFDLCQAFQGEGYVITVVTNQSGVARGLYSEEHVNGLHAWMSGEFEKRGISIAKFYYCPHLPDGTHDQYSRVCACRKPAPGMILQAKMEFGLDMAASVLVGDRKSDIEAAIAAGVGSAYQISREQKEQLNFAIYEADVPSELRKALEAYKNSYSIVL